MGLSNWSKGSLNRMITVTYVADDYKFYVNDGGDVGDDDNDDDDVDDNISGFEAVFFD